jgi:hypothetical protein
MNDKKLTLLGIIAVGMVIWAVAQSRISNKPRTVSDKPAYLIQGLETRDIDSIVVAVADDEVTLKRQAGYFAVANKDNYPAEMKQINELITNCLDIQTTQFITEKKENHETLGLTEAKAHHVVKFFKSDSSLLTGLIVGNAKQAGQGSYVRLATSDEVYVAPEAPWIRTDAMSYIDQTLTKVNRDDIESVTVVSPDGKYTLNKKDNGNGVELENIPTGKKLKDSDSKSVLNAATDVRFTDVKKKSAEANELTFDKEYFCKLKNSTVYTLKIANKDDKTFVSCQAVFTDTTPVTIKKEGESEEELKKKEAKLLARDKTQEFNARHQGWIYEIADWKAKNLTKELFELLEDEEKLEEKTEQKVEQDEQKPESAIDKTQTDEPNMVEAEP